MIIKTPHGLPISISLGNIKLGKIPNISLPPVITCPSNAPCTKLCYARKAYAGYARNTCKPAWDGNFVAFQQDADEYFETIDTWLCLQKKVKSIPYFRWHVSGDIINIAYFVGMEYLAKIHKDTNFLAFTRTHYNTTEHNLKLVRSRWLNEVPLYSLPFFKVVSEVEDIDTDFLRCPGNCQSCHACWHLVNGEGIYTLLH